MWFDSRLFHFTLVMYTFWYLHIKLFLKHHFSASAVARSWGDKVVAYVQTWEADAGDSSFYRFIMFLLDPGLGINPCAFLVSLGSVLLLLDGVKESKNVTNFFSTLNVSLVFFMAAMSLILAKRENMTPFIPPEFGVSYDLPEKIFLIYQV